MLVLFEWEHVIYAVVIVLWKLTLIVLQYDHVIMIIKDILHIY